MVGRWLLRTPLIGSGLVYSSAALAVTCPAGSYLQSGQSICTAAPAGYYVPVAGATAPIPAPAGTYAPASGSISPTTCPNGSFSYGGASACRAGTFGGTGTTSGIFVETLANHGSFSTIAGTTSSSLLTLANSQFGSGGGLHISDITLRSISIVGGNGAFSVLGFTPGTVLGVSSLRNLTVQFAPTTADSYGASLVIGTDLFADFGTAGQSFTIQLSGTGLNDVAPLPEPATWATMITGFGLVGGALRRRRRVAFA